MFMDRKLLSMLPRDLPFPISSTVSSPILSPSYSAAKKYSKGDLKGFYGKSPNS